jgi:hypothetical protein
MRRGSCPSSRLVCAGICCHKYCGCGGDMSCLRRLRDWHAAGVQNELHEVLLARLRAADQIHWSRVIVDSSSMREMSAGQKRDLIPQTARDPVPNTTSLPKRRASHSRSCRRARGPSRGYTISADYVSASSALAFIREAFLKLACCIICCRQLQNSLS